MSFVLDKNGEYLPVFGETSGGGGGGGTTDHAQLSNLDYTNSGHTGFMSNANYIAGGTTYNLKADGTGDFATLANALSFLEGKWSDGVVNFQLAAGTYTTERLTLYGRRFNIPRVRIYGADADSTIVQFINQEESYSCFWGLDKGLELVIQNITFQNTSGTKNTNYFGIQAEQGARIFVSNFKSIGLARAFFAFNSSLINFGGNITIQDSYTAICSMAANIAGAYGTITLNNCNNGFWVQYGGMINLIDCTTTYTSVNQKANETIGTATSKGYITGVTV